MANSLRKAEIIVRNQHPHDYAGYVPFKGQLYLDSSSGRYYKSLSAGRRVAWEAFNTSAASPTTPSLTAEAQAKRDLADDIYATVLMTPLPPSDMPSSVVWSDGLTSSFATPVVYRPNIVGKGSKTDNWNSVTGTPDPNFFFDPGYFETANGGNNDLEMHGEYKTGGVSQAASWNVAVEFVTSVTDAFEMGFYDTGAGAIHLEVNGIVAGYFAAPSGLASGKKVTVTFPRAAARHIRVSGAARLSHVWLKTAATLAKPTKARRRGAIFGDSYVGGAGGVYGMISPTPPGFGTDRGATQVSSFAPDILRLMGSNADILAGIGGRGFVATAQPYIVNVPEVLALNPNFILATGSINDPMDGTGVQAAVEAFLDATVSVTERYVATVTWPLWSGCSNAIKAAVAAHGNGVKLLDVSNLFSGSGNTVDGGTGVRGLMVMDDNSHPTYQGHRLIARQLHREYLAVR